MARLIKRVVPEMPFDNKGKARSGLSAMNPTESQVITHGASPNLVTKGD